MSAAAGAGQFTWGTLAGGLTSAGIVGLARGNPYVGATVASATNSYVEKKFDEAVNAPPYNGRPIFEIEHGLTGPNSRDKAGTDY